MHIHLDPVGGVAGDMFIAAMLDAFPEHQAGMSAAIRAAGLPSEIALSAHACGDGALTGMRFSVDVDAPIHHGREHQHHQHHDHRAFAEIRAMLAASSLEPAVRDRAIAMFELLAEVEGKIHGVPPLEVSFHELGGWDSIADIVGASYLIVAAGAQSWSVGALPLGSGTVATAHGRLPVPSPATALLLKGFRWHDDGVPGERVTPTGAVILRHLQCAQTLGKTAQVLVRTGHGFGTRKLPAMSNVLRVMSFAAAERLPAKDEQVAVIAFEVDDQTAEDLAVGLQHLREHDGVLDVIQIPAFGKKGRMLAQIQVLVEPERLESAIEACFAQTTTVGLRYSTIQRSVLRRRGEHANTASGQLRVKRVTRPDGTETAKAEMDDVARAAADHASRKALAQTAESGVKERDRD